MTGAALSSTKRYKSQKRYLIIGPGLKVLSELAMAVSWRIEYIRASELGPASAGPSEWPRSVSDPRQSQPSKFSLNHREKRRHRNSTL